MATNDPAPLRAVRRPLEARRELELLLLRLLCDRQRSEQHAAERGRPDPLKELTGRSALDRAIDETRAMLQRVDALIDDVRGGAHSPVVTFRSQPASRAAALTPAR